MRQRVWRKLVKSWSGDAVEKEIRECGFSSSLSFVEDVSNVGFRATRDQVDSNGQSPALVFSLA